MAIWCLTLLIVTSILLTKLIEGCSPLDCPLNEKICSCFKGLPDPEPAPRAFVAAYSCKGYLYYCSVGGECKPKQNGCPRG